MLSGGRAWTRCSVFVLVHLEIAADSGGLKNSETLLTSCNESCEFSKGYLDRRGCQHAEEKITPAGPSSCSQTHGIVDSWARPHREGLGAPPGPETPGGSEQAEGRDVLIRHKLLERQTSAQGLCALRRKLTSRPTKVERTWQGVGCVVSLCDTAKCRLIL